MNESSSTESSRLNQRLRELHRSVRVLQPDLARLAVALYDAESGQVHTYAYSSDETSPLLHYGVKLDEVPSLQKLAESGKPRIIPDLRQLGPKGPAAHHTQVLLDAGYRSSYTVPIRNDSELLGFMFFNSTQTDAFSGYLLPHLEICAYAVSLLIIAERAEFNTLRATLKSAVEVTHQRNPETGDHLRRIANYARLITQELAEPLALSDAYIEHLVLFSSLHDIGKISIPDAILLKPGRLDIREFSVMKTHTTRGLEMIDGLIQNHALESLDYIEVLRHIVELHHENWDGSGYPRGLAGQAIPLEARIIAVADVFDALTSERPYKERLNTEQAFAIMERMRDSQLDPVCFDAFARQRAQVEAIWRQFTPEP